MLTRLRDRLAATQEQVETYQRLCEGAPASDGSDDWPIAAELIRSRVAVNCAGTGRLIVQGDVCAWVEYEDGGCCYLLSALPAHAQALLSPEHKQKFKILTGGLRKRPRRSSSPR